MKYDEVIPLAYLVSKDVLKTGIVDMRNAKIVWKDGKSGEEAPDGAILFLIEHPEDSVSWLTVSHRVGKDVFFTRAEAKVQAEKIRAKAIAMLEKRISKIRAVVF